MSKNFIMCPNGHYYDPDQHSSCPHCESAGDFDETVDMTLPPDNNSFTGEDRTVPDYSVTSNSFSDFTVPNAPFEDDYTDETIPESTDDFDKTIGIKMWNTQGEDIAEKIDKKFQEDRGPVISPVVGWLVCTKGAEKGRSFSIVPGRNFIGRNPDSDISIQGDKSISRDKHAIIIFDPRSNRFHTQPGTSNELFYLNGEVVLEAKVMNDRDDLLIGNTELKFVAFCNDSFRWDQ